MAKEERIFGRSPSLVAKHRKETSDKYVGGIESLIYRTIQDRPQNENALRGMA